MAGIAVVGEAAAPSSRWSRCAMRRAGGCDAALAPAAHGTAAGAAAGGAGRLRGRLRRDGARRGAARRLVLFADDPYDPDPAARAAAFTAGMARAGAECLVLDRPAAPTGHGAARDPAFDPRFGARLAAFLAGQASSAMRP